MAHYDNLVFVPDKHPIRSLELKIFSRGIGADWSPIYADRFHH